MGVPTMAHMADPFQQIMHGFELLPNNSEAVGQHPVEPLGTHLETTWSHLETTWTPRGSMWKHLEAIWKLFGTTLKSFGNR